MPETTETMKITKDRRSALANLINQAIGVEGAKQLQVLFEEKMVDTHRDGYVGICIELQNGWWTNEGFDVEEDPEILDARNNHGQDYGPDPTGPTSTTQGLRCCTFHRTGGSDKVSCGGDIYIPDLSTETQITMNQKIHEFCAEILKYNEVPANEETLKDLTFRLEDVVTQIKNEFNHAKTLAQTDVEPFTGFKTPQGWDHVDGGVQS